MSDIENKKLEQLKKYLEWEESIYCDCDDHIVNWAISEIERLREALNEKNGGLSWVARK